MKNVAKLILLMALIAALPATLWPIGKNSERELWNWAKKRDEVRSYDRYLQAFVRNNPGRKLELEADKELTVEQLVTIWDALTRAGFEVKDVPARIRVPGESNE